MINELPKPGIIEIFARCTSCGRDGVKISNIERWAQENDIMCAVYRTGNPKHEVNNKKHLQYLEKAGLTLTHHLAIVVEDTNKITKLRDWTIPR